MRLPAESASSWVHIAFASFTWSSINAWAEFLALPQGDRDALAGMATSLRTALETLLKEARETQDVMIFGRPEAQAKQNAWLTLLKRMVNEALAIVAIKVGGNSKDHPSVREFLPNLMATVTGRKIGERSDAVDKAAGRLEMLKADFPEKADLVQRLRAAGKGAKDAIEASSDAWSSWSRERSEEIVAKGRLRLELEKTHRLLGAQFPGQRDFVESFFLRGSKASEGAEEEAAPEESPGEGSNEG